MKKIDLNKIEHAKMKELVAAYKLEHVEDFEKINVPPKRDGDEEFRNHFAVFSVNAPAAKAWDCYNKITPVDTWSGKLIDYVALYDSQLKEAFYPTSQGFPPITTGQRLFIQLNLLKGLVKILVGHQVVRKDDNLMEIETQYLENSGSRGSQIVRIVPNGPDKCIIEHASLYTSGSWFRDVVLYPPLHQMVISEFHRNVAKFIAAQGK